MRDCEWIEATTGSLGHGLSMGVGMAMAFQTNKCQAKVYVMLGDGECEEGNIWEAAMLAAAQGLSNLIVILDSNKIQKMDFVDKTIGEPDWRKKWSAFGWDVDETDGHNMEEFASVLKQPTKNAKPRIIIAHTIKGKGVSII